MTDPADRHHDIIAIGGSLGAVEAVKRLCMALPGDLAAAVLVTIHVGARGQDLLGSIFNEAGPLSAATARDGEAVCPGRIYVAPADHHLLTIDGVIRLGRGPRENMARPAIDPLFRSVAVEYGPRVIGVVLTGLLDDGAAGLADVKRRGGVTVVQSPTDAEARDMPLDALNASDVDHVAPLRRLPSLLAQLSREPVGTAAPAPADMRLEVDIALGRQVGTADIEKLADPAALSCPTCGGVLSQMRRPPLRFRCQVGHGFSAQTLASKAGDAVDEALSVSLRILQERLNLAEKMAEDARRSGRHAAAAATEERAEEYKRYAYIINRALEGEEPMRVP